MKVGLLKWPLELLSCHLHCSRPGSTPGLGTACVLVCVLLQLAMAWCRPSSCVAVSVTADVMCHVSVSIMYPVDISPLSRVSVSCITARLFPVNWHKARTVQHVFTITVIRRRWGRFTAQSSQLCSGPHNTHLSTSTYSEWHERVRSNEICQHKAGQSTWRATLHCVLFLYLINQKVQQKHSLICVV